jgi:hypothetical protein
MTTATSLNKTRALGFEKRAKVNPVTTAIASKLMMAAIS